MTLKKQLELLSAHKNNQYVVCTCAAIKPQPLINRQILCLLRSYIHHHNILLVIVIACGR